MTDTPTAVIDFAGDAPRFVERKLDPGRVVRGDPLHQTGFHFESADGELVAGHWRSTPGKWRAFADRDEFCYIIDGHVRLVDAGGTAKTYRGGDAFLIPNGFEGYWDVIETTTKYFVIRNHGAG